MYEHVIDDEQAPATCDAHKTLFSPSDEVKAACDFWWKWPCIVEQDLKTHPQIKWHENEIFFFFYWAAMTTLSAISVIYKYKWLLFLTTKYFSICRGKKWVDKTASCRLRQIPPVLLMW